MVIMDSGSGKRRLTRHMSYRVSRPNHIPISNSHRNRMRRCSGAYGLSSKNRGLRSRRVERYRRARLFVYLFGSRLIISARHLRRSTYPTNALTVRRDRIEESFHPTTDIKGLCGLMETKRIARVSCRAYGRVRIFYGEDAIVSSNNGNRIAIGGSRSAKGVQRSISDQPTRFSGRMEARVFRVLRGQSQNVKDSSRGSLTIFCLASVNRRRYATSNSGLFVKKGGKESAAMGDVLFRCAIRVHASGMEVKENVSAYVEDVHFNSSVFFIGGSGTTVLEVN